MLLFNIQHATIAQVYTQAHCILPTLPTHINKACSTMHSITVYVPFFTHTHYMHSFLPCTKISPVSFPSQPVSNACSNIYTHRKKKVNYRCIALIHVMERIMNVLSEMAQLVGKTYISSLPAAIRRTKEA